MAEGIGGEYHIIESGEILAAITVSHITPTEAIIDNIRCREEYRGKGLEYELLLSVINAAKRSKINLSVSVNNTEKGKKTIEFLEQHNFVEHSHVIVMRLAV